MPTSYEKKVVECIEIIDTGTFDDWQQGFLRKVRKQIRMSGERSLSGPQKGKIDECYDAACRSPH